MVTATKATVPTISDQASAMQLSQCAKNLASALAELRTAAQKVLWQHVITKDLNVIVRIKVFQSLFHRTGSKCLVRLRTRVALWRLIML